MVIRVIQINLHRSAGATGVLVRAMEELRIDVAMIQEPWFMYGAPRGLGMAGIVYAVKTGERTRSCIVVNRRITATLMPHLSSGDVTTVSIQPRGKTLNELILISAYSPGNAARPAMNAV